MDDKGTWYPLLCPTSLTIEEDPWTLMHPTTATDYVVGGDTAPGVKRAKLEQQLRRLGAASSCRFFGGARDWRHYATIYLYGGGGNRDDRNASSFL